MNIPLFRSVFAAIVIFIALQSEAQTGAAQSLGLYGCSVKQLASTSSGTLQLIACTGTPNGLYYTVDFGQNWAAATGGAYSVGTGEGVAINASSAFAIAGSQRKFFKAALPSSGGSWTPDWQEVSTGLQASDLAITDSYAYVATGDSVKVFNASNNSLIQTATYPDVGVSSVSIAVWVSEIYAIARSGNTTYLYKAILAGDGSIGSWTSLNSLPGGSVADKVFIAPNQFVYVNVRAGTPGIYQSNDSGTSFTKVINGVASSACFGGSNHIIGTNFSRNTGSTFSSVGFGNNFNGSTAIRFEDKACLFDPSSSERFLMGTTRGVARTTQFETTPGDPTYADGVTGIEGVTAYSIGQLLSNKSRVIVGSNAGIAATDNFTAPSPTWDWTCPGNDCVGGQNVVADVEDNSKFYVGSGAIYRGVATSVGGTAHFTWSSFINKPADRHNYAALRSYSFLPQTLVASYYQVESGISGGLYFYNTSDASLRKLVLNGTPLGDFIALNANIMFLIKGNSGDASPTGYTRGIYKSINGGDDWSLMGDADLGSDRLFHKFAYDTSTDTLTATESNQSSNRGTIYYLTNALTGGEDWRTSTGSYPDKSSGINITAIATDDSGTTYVAGESTIYSTRDNGTTWVKVTVGRENEDYKVLYFDALVAGSTTGLAAISQTEVPTPTSIPTTAPTVVPTSTPIPTCSLKVKKVSVKKGKVSKPKLEYTAIYSGSSSNAKLQKRANAKAVWKTAASLNITSSSTKGTFALPNGTTQYRGVFADCVTATSTYKIRK